MASVRKKQRLIKKRTPYWNHRYAKPFIVKKAAAADAGGNGVGYGD